MIIDTFFYENCVTFYENLVNATKYSQMLIHFVIPALQQRQTCLGKAIFMPDGACPHSLRIQQNLREKSAIERVIKSCFETAWLRKSPDFIPCDIWQWGHLKIKLYQRVSSRHRTFCCCEICAQYAIFSPPKQQTHSTIFEFGKLKGNFNLLLILYFLNLLCCCVYYTASHIPQRWRLKLFFHGLLRPLSWFIFVPMFLPFTKLNSSA